MTEDRSKMPDGYTTHRFTCADGQHRWDVFAELGDSFATEADAIAACWGHADEQRAIGAAQERAKREGLWAQFDALADRVMAAVEDPAERDARVRRDALLEAAEKMATLEVFPYTGDPGERKAWAQWLRELADKEPTT